MTILRVQFEVATIAKLESGFEKVNFHAADGESDVSPSATCSMLIVNPEFYGQFTPGQKFDVDFNPAP